MQMRVLKVCVRRSQEPLSVHLHRVLHQNDWMWCPDTRCSDLCLHWVRCTLNPDTLSSHWPKSCSARSALLSVVVSLPLLPGIVSIMTLAALAYERYIRVVHAQVVDFPWAWRAIAHIWLYSLAWTGAPLLGWNRYTLEIHRLGCSLDWTSKDPNDASFILLFLLACFFVPVGVMIYCYGNILYTVQRVRNKKDCLGVFLLLASLRNNKINKLNEQHGIVSEG